MRRLPLRLAAALLALGLAALPACRRAAPDPATLAKNYIQYPVSKGESLESISKQFFVKPEQLRQANHLGRKEQPAPGRTILIPRWK